MTQEQSPPSGPDLTRGVTLEHFPITLVHIRRR